VDDLEGVPHDAGRLLFVTRVVLGLHQSVDQALDDADLGLLELLARVAAHRVRDGRHVEVALGRGVGVLDVAHVPDAEQVGAGRRLLGLLLGLDVLGFGLGGFFFAHLTGFSAFPRTSSISDTPLTFSTL
jgi:hypothetical protein